MDDAPITSRQQAQIQATDALMVEQRHVVGPVSSWLSSFVEWATNRTDLRCAWVDYSFDGLTPASQGKRQYAEATTSTRCCVALVFSRTALRTGGSQRMLLSSRPAEPNADNYESRVHQRCANRFTPATLSTRHRCLRQHPRGRLGRLPGLR